MFENINISAAGTMPVSVIVISVAIMLFCGFAATRITKLLRLPNVTAYILTGVALGPCCANMVPSGVIEGTEFISDIALAFIAFSTGEYFKINILLSNGPKLLLITMLEAMTASALVFILTFFVLHLPLPFSIILSVLASATAPASTLMTIKQTNAKGAYVDTLLSVVALDNIVSLISFSVAVSLSIAVMGGSLTPVVIMKPILLNLLMIAIGALMGCLLRALVTAKRSEDNRLIVAVALLFALCGIGAALDVSPLLGCMAMGMIYTNLAEDGTLFRQINYFSPPVLLLFFVRSGLQFRLDALMDMDSAVSGKSLLLIGVLYFIVRIAGKYGGAWLGCLAAGTSAKVRSYLGLALIPQAGVAIGLAAMGARIIGGEMGSMLQTIIMSSSILYEIAGPACAKLGLYLSGSFADGQEHPAAENAQSGEDAELASMKEELSAIQNKISGGHPYCRILPAPEPDIENDEYYSIMDYMRHHGRIKKMR